MTLLRITLSALAIGLAACGGSDSDAPTRLDDACAIAAQRPAYISAMQRTERKWGVPVPVQMATLYQESKFRSDARTPFRYTLGVIPMGRQSSAFGYAQALDATWDEYRQDTGNRGARRNRIGDATDFMGWYMDITEQRNGVSKSSAGKQYLAYHEGHTGYARASYRRKPWLMRVANEVDLRAQMYDLQLRQCGKR